MPPLGETVWADTVIELPPALASRQLVNVLDGARLTAEARPDGEGGTVRASAALASFPVALLAQG